MTTTHIEWTDVVWNPTTGCDRVSDGCDNCYALIMAKRLKGMEQARIEKGTLKLADAKYQTDGDPRTSGPGFGPAMHPDALGLPFKWAKPRKVFVNSMSDLFHPKFTDEFIGQVFAVMAATPQHTYQVLTKRPARMRVLLTRFLTDRLVSAMSWDMGQGLLDDDRWPLPNVWLGVSTEDQEQADRRIPQLLNTPAAVRWISAEPLLGHIDLGAAALVPYEREQGGFWRYDARTGPLERPEGKTWVPAPPAQLDWVVVGGESGRGARPMRPEWARSLRDQCRRADVPFLFKQWGAHDVSGKRVGKGKAGRELNGRTHDEYPAVAS